jgi:integrase
MSSKPQTVGKVKNTGANDRQSIISGVRLNDPNNTVNFDFRQDVWDLRDVLRPHQRNYNAKVNFSDMPGWLREDAKHFVLFLYTEIAVDLNRINSAMVALRRLGRLLSNFGGCPIDLGKQHAWAVARHLRSELGYVYADKNKVEINQFMVFIRQRHPEKTNNFQIILPKPSTTDSSSKPLTKRGEDIVTTDVCAQIIDACICDLKAYRDYLKTYIDTVDDEKEYNRIYQRNRLRRLSEGTSLSRPVGKVNHLLGKAIKGQALILMICVGRRAAAVCNTRFNVYTKAEEWVNEEGQTEKGVLIRFKEMKITNAYEDVFCPDAFGELALSAIRTAKELTAELRRHNPQWKDYLFLTPALQRKAAHVLSSEQINDYLNGSKKKEGGLLSRYEITHDHITTHMFRRTRATKAWIGGMQEHEVSRDLGHFNVDTTLRHYIAGNEESRRRFQTLVEHGALSDTLQKLSGEVELLQTTLGRRQVEVMDRQGLVLRPTRYGYCALGGSGHCVKTTACYLGPEVESDGCDYHVLTPDALPGLEEDKEALETSIALNSDSRRCNALVQSMRNQLNVIDRKIELARTQQSRVDSCQGSNHCKCKPRVERGATVSND